MPDSLLAQQPHIRWKEIKGFQDVLIHQYDAVRVERVWAALEDLPNLRAAVEALLTSLPPSPDDKPL